MGGKNKKKIENKGRIADWKNSEKGGLCLLPADAGDIGLDDF